MFCPLMKVTRPRLQLRQMSHAITVTYLFTGSNHDCKTAHSEMFWCQSKVSPWIDLTLFLGVEWREVEKWCCVFFSLSQKLTGIFQFGSNVKEYSGLQSSLSKLGLKIKYRHCTWGYSRSVLRQLCLPMLFWACKAVRYSEIYPVNDLLDFGTSTIIKENKMVFLPSLEKETHRLNKTPATQQSCSHQITFCFFLQDQIPGKCVFVCLCTYTPAYKYINKDVT